MEYLDNPAGRLLATFQAVRQTDQSSAAVAGWSKVFRLPDSDIVQFMKRVAHLFELAAETRRQVESLTDDDPGVMLEHFNEVEATLARFQAVISLNMEQFLSSLGPKSGEYSLKLCSSLLHRRAAESTLDKDTATWLGGQLDELIAEVVEAQDLEPHTKDWVVRRLNDIREVLLDLRIHGIVDLEAATARLVGGLAGKPERIASVSGSKIKKRLVGFIVAVDLAVNLGANVHELTAGEAPHSSPIVVELEKQTGVKAEIPALPPALGGQVQPN